MPHNESSSLPSLSPWCFSSKSLGSAWLGLARPRLHLIRRKSETPPTISLASGKGGRFASPRLRATVTARRGTALPGGPARPCLDATPFLVPSFCICQSAMFMHTYAKYKAAADSPSILCPPCAGMTINTAAKRNRTTTNVRPSDALPRYRKGSALAGLQRPFLESGPSLAERINCSAQRSAGDKPTTSKRRHEPRARRVRATGADIHMAR